jgi:hypothetical protein
VEEQVRAGAIPATIFRLPKVYGPHDDEHHVVERQLSFLICQRDLKTQSMARHPDSSRDTLRAQPRDYSVAPLPAQSRNLPEPARLLLGGSSTSLGMTRSGF